MVDITHQIPAQNVTVRAVYVLFLPDKIVTLDDLQEGAYQSVFSYGSFWMDAAKLYVPIDLITAARLKIIRPGDSSGLGDEQWAWMKLIGLTGEN